MQKKEKWHCKPAFHNIYTGSIQYENMKKLSVMETFIIFAFLMTKKLS